MTSAIFIKKKVLSRVEKFNFKSMRLFYTLSSPTDQNEHFSWIEATISLAILEPLSTMNWESNKGQQESMFYNERRHSIVFQIYEQFEWKDRIHFSSSNNSHLTKITKTIAKYHQISHDFCVNFSMSLSSHSSWFLQSGKMVKWNYFWLKTIFA